MGKVPNPSMKTNLLFKLLVLNVNKISSFAMNFRDCQKSWLIGEVLARINYVAYKKFVTIEPNKANTIL